MNFACTGAVIRVIDKDGGVKTTPRLRKLTKAIGRAMKRGAKVEVRTYYADPDADPITYRSGRRWRFVSEGKPYELMDVRVHDDANQGSLFE